MEMRLLEYAIEVYRKKSFTKAAQTLCIAQPSLSQQISKLERSLGVTLFYRGHGGVEVTPDGLRFIEQAEQIVRMRDDLIREMNERREGIGRELVIGITAITGGHVLPPLLKAYKEQYPQVQVRLVEESTATLEELTAKGLADVSILSLPLDDSRLATRVMLTEPIFVAVPRVKKDWMPTEVQRRIEFAILETDEEPISHIISLADLSNAPFILLKQGFGFRRTILELCAKHGFQPHIAYETSSIETAQSLVTYGLGVTLVPDMVRRHVHPHPLYLSLDSKPSRTLVFAYRAERYLSLAARALLDIYEKLSSGEIPVDLGTG
ncbi:putative HTH-type transcriptional regulator YcgK [Collibacillus ludicampi]|uniref:HTH-type transcriptional regulator YcgK n=1 Tax=Collibacillus ludicampi TaxID=2771369 RepID=A0AAV4LBB6_9BACL|nr:LysR family transcriptional regulator [Collibacillus ludicampi]GIM45083.1 putative HTH-type transcriptional regulator YcgK [Collibacillus ludicampi]